MRGIILSVITVILLAYGVRGLLYYGARQHTSGEYDKLNTIFLRSNDYDLLYLGSSRAESHFQPQLIDSITGLRSYNAGLEGSGMPMIYSTLKAYLHHSRAPRFIVLNVDLHVPDVDNSLVYRFPRYFPYLSNPELYKGLCKRDGRFPYFRWIPFYSMPFYNDKYLNASVRGIAGIKGKTDAAWVKGYAPVPPELAIDLDTVKYLPYTAQPDKLFFQSIDSILALCKIKNIKPVFVISPIYHRHIASLADREKLFEMLETKAVAAGVPLLSYLSDSLSYQKQMFIDTDHLSAAGSRSFSMRFALDLKQYLAR